MKFKLQKFSSPGWEKEYETQEELIDNLRSHICGGCLSGGEWDYEVVDVEYNGNIYECRDIPTLLSTACGCEYGVSIDEEK